MFNCERRQSKRRVEVSTLFSDRIQPPRELRFAPRNKRCTSTPEVDSVRTLAPRCRTDTSNLSGIVVHSAAASVPGGIGGGTPLDYSDLPPIGSSNAQPLSRQSRRSSSASIAPLKYPRRTSHTNPTWYYYQSANPVSGHTRIYLHLRCQRTTILIHRSHLHSVPPIRTSSRRLLTRKSLSRYKRHKPKQRQNIWLLRNYNSGHMIGTKPGSN